MRAPRTLSCFLVLFFLGASFVQAGFFSREKPEKPGRVQSTETDSFRVHFARNGRYKTVFDREGQDEIWVQVEYKFVGVESGIDNLFDASGWLVLEFEDKAGFVLVSEAFRRSELGDNLEYQGEFWERFKKVVNIDGASVRTAHAGRLDEILAKKREATELIQKVNDLEAGTYHVPGVIELVMPADKRPVTDESQGYELEEDEEDEGEPVQVEPYDPFDDPNRIRNEDVTSELMRREGELIPDDAENVPPLPGSITNEEVTLYAQEASAPAEPRLEFVGG